MKKMIICLALLGMGMSAMAQEDKESKYIRNSLYMMRLDMPLTDASDQASMKALNAGIDKINWEERYKQYNSVALKKTSLTWAELPAVTQAEKDAIKKESEVQKALNEQIKKSLAESGIKSSPYNEADYAARLLKYFNTKKYGNDLVAKWHLPINADYTNFTAWDNNIEMIAQYGLKGLSADAKAKATASQSLTSSATGLDAENKLLDNTYICVNRFGYMSAKEVICMLTAPIKAKLATAPSLLQAGLNAAITKIESNTKGYFICCNSYLFKLDWNNDAQNFAEKYWYHVDAFKKSANYKISYVGHTDKRINCLTFKKGAEQNALMAAAALKGSDKCMVELQKEYDNFKPMTALHEDGGRLIAYIGTKEGVSEKSSFDVYTAEEGKDGIVTWKKVGSLKPEKGKVWDNAEKVPGEKVDEDDATGDAGLTFTTFAGKPSKKIFGGCMVKLVK